MSRVISKILSHKTNSVFFAAFWVGFFALVSRLFGLWRNRLLASNFGAGAELDIYYAAFRIPDLVFNILIIGAISSVLIPVFTEYLEKDRKEAEEFLNAVINSFLIFLILISAVLIIFTPYLMKLIAPGFSMEAQKLTTTLTRIMFLSPLFLGLSSIFGSTLQVFKKFIAYSLAPVMYNIGIIAGILFFVPLMGIYGLAFGVAFGALLHLLIQTISYSHLGFHFRLSFNFWHSGLKKTASLMIPRVVSISVSQLNFFVITAIASFLGAGSIAVFNFANDFQYLPIGIVAIAFSTAVFPVLSSAAAKNSIREFNEHLTGAALQILFFVVPLSVLFFVLRAQIVRLILGAGMFDWTDTRLTAAALGLFCFGIFAQSLIPLFTRAFFAFQNTVIPVIINVLSVGVNIGLSVYFVHLIKSSAFFASFIGDFLKISDISDFSIVGLTLAFSISGILNLILLIAFFHNKFINLDWNKISSSVANILMSSLAMFAAVYLSLYAVARVVDMQKFIGVLIQATAASLVGALVYFAVSFLLKSDELKFVTKNIKGVSFKKFIGRV